MVFKDVNRNEHQLSPSAFIPQRHPDESHPVDITEAATDTIDYVVTDPAGLTSTSTRTVIVEAPANDNTPPAANDNQASSDASSTSASSTTQ
jgi:hypothetical protein